MLTSSLWSLAVKHCLPLLGVITLSKIVPFYIILYQIKSRNRVKNSKKNSHPEESLLPLTVLDLNSAVDRVKVLSVAFSYLGYLEFKICNYPKQPGKSLGLRYPILWET